MNNSFFIKPLSQSTINLSNVASGKIKPDLVITDARILYVFTEQYLNNKEILIMKYSILGLVFPQEILMLQD